MHSLEIRNPTATDFEVSINSTLTDISSSAKHAKIDEMDVAVFLEGNDPIEPIMTLTVDEIHGNDDAPIIKENIKVPIENEGALDDFALLLMDAETMRMAMRGKTKIHLGAIKANIDYNEVVTMKGLNKLDGMVITDYSLKSTGDYNVEGKVMIPNPTVVTIEMVSSIRLPFFLVVR